MNAALLASVLLLASPGAGTEELLGTWKLVSYTRTLLDTRETTNVFGTQPKGYITYGRDGRMMVLIVKADRPNAADAAKVTDEQRAEWFKGMIAYAGTYTVDGKNVVHHIDVAANENWAGTDQVRSVKRDGNKLVLTANGVRTSYDGKVGDVVLTFEKVMTPRAGSQDPDRE